MEGEKIWREEDNALTKSESEQYVTLGDSARELGIPYSSLYAIWKAGKIKHQRAGSAILVRVSDVRDAMKNYKPRGIGKPANETVSA